MAAKFDPDSALKDDLRSQYKRLLSRYDRLKRTLETEKEDRRVEAETSKERNNSSVRKGAAKIKALWRDEVSKYKAQLGNLKEEIETFQRTVEALRDPQAKRALVRAEFAPGLRSPYPETYLFIDLIVDSHSFLWQGGRACGYARDENVSGSIYPFILEDDRLDYGADFEEDRDGRFLVRGRPIQSGETVPFFRDGKVTSEGGETYVVRRVFHLIEGR